MGDKKKVGIWLADESLLLDHDGTVSDFLNDYLHATWTLRRKPLVHEYDNRAMWSMNNTQHGTMLPRIPYSDRPTLKINQLYWPAGASRYAEMYAVVDQATLGKILKKAWNIELRPEGTDLFIKTESGEDLLRRVNETVDLAVRYPGDLDIDIPMYVADYRILGGKYNAPWATKLCLVHLVDERFFWQQMGFGGQCQGRPATGPPAPDFPTRAEGATWWSYTKLFEELLASVHVTDYQLSISHSGYAYPDPVEWCRPFESVGVMLDAAAASTGLRISRDLTGTLRLLNPWEAWTYAFTEIEDNEDVWNAQAGGSYQPGPRFSRLLMAFPRNYQGHVDCTPDRWYWALVQNNLGHTDDYNSHELIDESCYTWSAILDESLFGTPGVNEVVYSSHYAYFDDPTDICPDNWVALKTQAFLIFRDRALWNDRIYKWESLDIGITPVQPSPLLDYTLYDFATEGRCEYELHIPPQDPDSEAHSPPRLEKTRNRMLNTFQVALSTDQHPRHSLNQDGSPLTPERPYFEIQTAALKPGGSASAKWVYWDDTGGTWDYPSAVLSPTVYDPYHRAFALPDEVVRCEWHCERKQWEVCEVRGLRRNAVVTETGGISAGSTGTVTIYKDDVATTTTVEAELVWMDMAQDLAEDAEIAIWYNIDEERWIIDGAEC